MTTVFASISYEVINKVCLHMEESETYSASNSREDELKAIGYENVLCQVLNSRRQFSSLSQALLRFGGIWESSLQRFDQAFALSIKTINQDLRDSLGDEMWILQGEAIASEQAFLWLGLWMDQDLDTFGDYPEMTLPEDEVYYARLVNYEVCHYEEIRNVLADRKERMPDVADNILYWLR